MAKKSTKSAKNKTSKEEEILATQKGTTSKDRVEALNNSLEKKSRASKKPKNNPPEIR